MPQFDFSFFPSQIFWLFFFFIAQYLIISRLIVPALKNIQESRKSYLDKQLKLAELMLEQSESLKAQYEAKLEENRVKSITKMNEALSSIQKDTDKTLSNLDKTLAEDFKKYEKEYSALKTSLQKDLDNIAISIAKTIVNKISDLNISTKDLNKYIN